MFRRTVHLPLAASPCGWLSQPRSPISQSDFRQAIGSPSPCRLVGPYKLRLNLTDLPLFTWKPLAACRRLEPRKHSRTLALTHPGILSSPLSHRVDCFNHDRFRGYAPVHSHSGLLPSALRFAVYVTGHHARLGTRLSARLCRGRHLRRLTSIRLQGATLIEPDVPISGIRLSDWFHCKAHSGAGRGRRSRHSTPRS